MGWRRDLRSRLRPRLSDRELDADIEEEFRTHLELRIQENLERGLSAEEARAEAERRMGDVKRWMGETKGVEMGIRNRRRLLERLDLYRQQFRQSLRALLRRPGFALPAILTLALGIGASTAGFAVVDAVVLRPLPYPDADRLVWLDSPVPGQGADEAWGLSVAGFFEFQREAASLDELGAYGVSSISIADESGARRVQAASVTAEVLDALAARPALGRLLEDEDDDPQSAGIRKILLSHEFWQREFGGDRGVVGRTVRIENEPSEIIGVLEAGFQLPEAEVQVWVPLFLDPSAPPSNSHWVSALGRLAPGASVASAQAELSRITGRFPELFPEAYSLAFMREFGFRTRVRPLAEHVVGPEVKASLWIVVAGVGLVLLIACANVANLLLVRIEGRSRESAVRAAIGAGRSELFGHALAESALLTLSGALVGLGIAAASLWLLISKAPPGLPSISSIEVSGLAVAFALGLALLIGLAFAILPALAGSVRYDALRDGGLGTTPGTARHAVRRGIVVVQVALAVVLLAGAGLMVRTVSELRNVDAGFEPGGAVAFELSLPRGPYQTPEAAAGFVREITARLESLPGVRTAGAGGALPFDDVMCVPVQGQAQTPGRGGSPPCTEMQRVSPGFFEALGVEVDGSDLSWAAMDANAGEAILTRTMADRLWPGEDPIGKQVRSADTLWYRVVGVTEPLRTHGLDAAPTDVVFYPPVGIEGGSWFGPMTRPVMVARMESGAGTAGLVPAVQEILQEIDPAVALGRMQTLEHHVNTSPSMVRRSFMMTLMAVVGGLALLLSVVGIYGVISYVVGRRTVELGVRYALGARRGQVMGMVLRDSLWMAGLGVSVGIVAAAGFSSALESLLFGVTPTDPLTLGTVALLLLGLALLAGWVPAYRAGRVDPIEALRAE